MYKRTFASVKYVINVVHFVVTRMWQEDLRLFIFADFFKFIFQFISEFLGRIWLSTDIVSIVSLFVFASSYISSSIASFFF